MNALKQGAIDSKGFALNRKRKHECIDSEGCALTRVPIIALTSFPFSDLSESMR